MTKKICTYLTILAMVVTMIPMFTLTAFALTQTERNARTGMSPKDATGLYSMIMNWGGNEVGFADEYLPTVTTSDKYIARLSISSSLTTYSKLSWMVNHTWGGNLSAFTTNANYAAGNAYFEYDFGISSKVTAMKYYTIFNDDATRNNQATGDIAKVLPKTIKVRYSDDKVTWGERTFINDFTDTANPLNSAYLDVLANGKNANATNLLKFKDPLNLDFGGTVNGRYFQVVIISPGQLDTRPENSTVSVKEIAFYDTTDQVWPGSGTGTLNDPYQISSASDLITMSSLVGTGTSKFTTVGKYFNVTNDINLSGVNWIPIGNGTTHFKGTFDGNGHIISNLSMGVAGTGNTTIGYYGLFGNVDSGTIKNLGIENVTIYGKDTSAGARFGSVAGYSADTISSCYAKNIHIENHGNGDAGGIVGENNGSVLNCYIGGTNNYLLSYRSGGIVADNDSTKIVQNCYTIGFTTISTAADWGNSQQYGPIVGSTSNVSTITNCYYNYTPTVTNTTGISKTLTDFADSSVAGVTKLLGNAYALYGGYPQLLPFVKPDYAIGTITSAGGIATVPVTKNVTGTAKLIIVAYNNNQMVAVKSYDISTLNGTNNYTLATNETNVRAFIWKDLETAKPLI